MTVRHRPRRGGQFLLVPKPALVSCHQHHADNKSFNIEKSRAAAVSSAVFMKAGDGGRVVVITGHTGTTLIGRTGVENRHPEFRHAGVFSVRSQAVGWEHTRHARRTEAHIGTCR